MVETVVDEKSRLERWKVADAEEIQSPIWRLWQEGTRYEWCWPCHQCGGYFIPRFSRLKWPAGATATEARKKAFMECPHNGCVIEEKHKQEMNARGVYVAPGQTITKKGVVKGDPPESNTVSFWVSGLCSPFVTFGERAQKFLGTISFQ